MSRKFPLAGLIATVAFGIGTAQGRECRGASFPDQIKLTAAH